MGPMRRMGLMIGACAFVSVLTLGCAATGWAPGEQKEEKAQVPTPFGTFVLEGQRDTTFTADLEGNDGVHIPNGRFALDRSASGPLATRGAQQLAIEAQRDAHFDRILDRVDRRIDRLEDIFLTRYAPPPLDPAALRQWPPTTTQNGTDGANGTNGTSGRPSLRDELLGLLRDPEIRAQLLPRPSP